MFISPRYSRATITIKFTTRSWSTQKVAPVPAIRCRQITETDVPGITALLARGFPSRDLQFWKDALAQLGARQPPADLPQYGYLLESGDQARRRDPADLRPGADRRSVAAALQLVELVRRTGVSVLWIAARVARARAQGRDLFEYFGGAAYLADHRSAGLLPLLRRRLRCCAGAEWTVRQLRREDSRRTHPADGRVRPVGTRHPRATRRTGLHQPVVRHVRARLPVRLPSATRQEAVAVRATDLLPRCRRFRSLCRAAWPPPASARQAFCNR